MNDLISIDEKHIWHPFTPLQTERMPLVTHGEGAYLYTADGKRLIDAISSWWVNLHGHGNSAIAEAIAAQARKLEHVIFAGFTHEPAITLSRNLLEMLPRTFSRVFFSDNGSTAVEVALKMAIQYWHNLGTPKKKVIAIKGAYHGDTFGSMSVGERGLFTEPFFPFLFQTLFIDFPAPGGEEKTVAQFTELSKDGDVAAFIFEPLVQAAGGMKMYSATCLDKLLEQAKKAGIVTIADEVFTGFGRTGKRLATDHVVHKPDIIALSKGITGGFMPLGVTACTKTIADAFDSPSLTRTFFHGHSYTANPLACAAANASYEILMTDECQERIAEISQRQQAFVSSVAANPKVLDARSLGTILAIELRTDGGSGYQNELRSAIYPYFLERGILLRPLGNTLYLVPPYVVEDDTLRYVHDTIAGFLKTL